MHATLQGQWRQLRGRIKERWAKMTKSALDWASVQYDQLVGILQGRYGHRMAVAEVRVSDFLGEAIDVVRRA